MREVKTSIFVPAAPEAVWSAFMDTRGWTALHGGVLSDAEPETPWCADSVHTVRVKPSPGAKATTLEACIDICEPGRLRWTTKVAGLGAARRSFWVEPAENGARFHNDEQVSGLVPELLLLFFPALLRRTLEGFNGGLRDRIIVAR